MNFRTLTLAGAIALSSLLPMAAAQAKLAEADLAHLGADLTPFGAEKAGNKDGSIPAWGAV